MPGKELGWDRLFDPDEEESKKRLATAIVLAATEVVLLKEEVEPEPVIQIQEPSEISAGPV